MRGAALFLVLWTCSPCRAAGSAGAEPFASLSLDADARAAALAGAYTALAQDDNALLYNAAGLGGVLRYQATFMHDQRFSGTSREYAAAAAPQGFGLEASWLGYPKIARTTLSQPDGAGLGEASGYDLSAAAGWGRRLLGGWLAGAAVKLVRETLDGSTGQGAAIDLGVLYAPAAQGLSLGAALQNLGPSVRFQGADEPLPLRWRAGAGYRFRVAGRAAALSVDVSKQRAAAASAAGGAEVEVWRSLALRAGYRAAQEAGFGATGGLGWTVGRLRVDYAFAPMGDLGDSHRLSVTVFWGDPGGA